MSISEAENKLYDILVQRPVIASASIEPLYITDKDIIDTASCMRKRQELGKDYYKLPSETIKAYNFNSLSEIPDKILEKSIEHITTWSEIDKYILDKITDSRARKIAKEKGCLTGEEYSSRYN